MTTITLAVAAGQPFGMEGVEEKKSYAIHPVKQSVQNSQPKAMAIKWTLPLESKHLFYTSSFFDGCRSVIVVANRVFATIGRTVSEKFVQVASGFRLSKLFDIVLVPFTLSSLATYIYRFIHRSEGRLETALNISSEAGSLGSSITTFAMGLASVSVLSAKALEWINPVYIISSVLSIAAVPLNMKTISKMGHIRDEFDKVAHLKVDNSETNLQDFRAALDFIKEKQVKDEDFISMVFNCSEDKLMDSLTSIQQQASQKLSSSNLEENIQGGRLLNKALHDMRKRFHHVRVASVLASIVATINCIGAIALLFTPAAPLVYGLIGVGVTVNIGNFIYQKAKEYHFTHAIGMEKKWYEWIG